VAWGLIGFAAALAIAASAGGTPVQAPGPMGPLEGTMLSGGSRSAPVVLIVPGSGALDRDGDSPAAGVRASSYRLLAEQLAARGVASVRIDKRGMYGSKAAVADANAATIEDYASDVHAWIAVIRASTGAHCVWVLGHSEGGLVALAAGRKPEDICGVVLVAAAGRPIGEIMREQIHANPANASVVAAADRAIDALEAKQRVDAASLPPALAQLFRPSVQDLLIDELAYDPPVLLASFHKPVLILQGERDLQTKVVDAQNLAKADPAAKLVLLPDVNHMLKTVTTDSLRANFATYADPSLPLAPGVADAVAGFVGGAKVAAGR
jgi:pimeloyl-ACP methyl ester carboxylesterase